MSEWQIIRDKIAELADLDKGCVVYGQSRRRYRFGPVVSDADITVLEDELGAPLPPELRSFYTEMGAYGPGPASGILAPENLFRSMVPTAIYPGAEAIAALTAHLDWPDPEEPDLHWIRAENLKGLLGVIDEGGTHLKAITMSGPRCGLLSSLTDDEILRDEPYGLIGYYTVWVDHYLNEFHYVANRVNARQTLAEIEPEYWEDIARPCYAAQTGFAPTGAAKLFKSLTG